MSSTTIHYGPCKNEVTGLFEYCQIYGVGTQRQQVHPIGYCRDNKLPGKTPCKHKTEDQARLCYQIYQVSKLMEGKIQTKDLLMIENVVERLEDMLKDVKQTHAAFLNKNNG